MTTRAYSDKFEADYAQEVLRDFGYRYEVREYPTGDGVMWEVTTVDVPAPVPHAPPDVEPHEDDRVDSSWLGDADLSGWGRFDE